MRTNIIVTDSFYEDPGAVREWALSRRYYYPYTPDADIASGKARLSWRTSWFLPADQCPFKSSPALIHALERITGDTIDMDHWNLGYPTDAEGKAVPTSEPRSCLWNCSFHFKPDNRQKIGDGVHNHVTDSWNSVGSNGWAGLIYLTEAAPLRGGLRLWRNRDPKRDFDWMTPAENWELIDDIGNVFNRLILCRGDLPHSGAAGWSDELARGRLYQTFFFRVKQPSLQANVSIPLVP